MPEATSLMPFLHILPKAWVDPSSDTFTVSGKSLIPIILKLAKTLVSVITLLFFCVRLGHLMDEIFKLDEKNITKLKI